MVMVAEGLHDGLCDWVSKLTSGSSLGDLGGESRLRRFSCELGKIVKRSVDNSLTWAYVDADRRAVRAGSGRRLVSDPQPSRATDLPLSPLDFDDGTLVRIPHRARGLTNGGDRPGTQCVVSALLTRCLRRIPLPLFLWGTLLIRPRSSRFKGVGELGRANSAVSLLEAREELGERE